MYKKGVVKLWHAILVFFVLAFMSEVSFAEIVNLEDAINKAGRQRMLTQRILKSYSMKGLEVQSEEAQKQLNTAVALFDEQLTELTHYSPKARVKQSLQRVGSLWQPIRTMIHGPVNRASARAILKKNDVLLMATEQVVKHLEKLSTTTHGRLVNIAGRQRMLSQRLAKFYMLRAWGIDNAMIRAEEKKAESAFRKAMGELMVAKENTASISKVLKQASLQWDLMKYALDRKGKNFVPLIVAMTSENLLKTMDQVTGMYAELRR